MTAIKNPEPNNDGISVVQHGISEENHMPNLSKHQTTNGSGIAGNIVGDGDAGDENGAGNANAGNGADNAPMQVPKPNGPIPLRLRKIEAVESGQTEPAQRPSEERMEKANAAFERFKGLQVDPKATVAARQIITTCTVRRPKNNEFVRVNVDAEPYTGFIHEDKDEDAFYIVTKEALPLLYASPPLKMLVLTINQNGAFFLWPVPVDDRNGWNDSARKAFQIAQTQWVKLVGDRAAGTYNTFLAEGELPPPRWPDKTYWELVDLAFPNSKVVNDADHEVVLKARTGQSRK
jgi:hypothetical protein